MKLLLALPVALSFTLAVGCGGNGGSGPPAATGISISPTSADVLVHQTVPFSVSVTGMGNAAVTWSVQEDQGGAVTSDVYQAPWTVGTYHVTATAVADPTKTATATITVSAETLFLETLPGGTSTPWSLTPVLGTLREDGTWETASVIDPNTGNPMDTSLYDLFLSADGTKAVGSVPQVDSQGHVAWNIVTFNTDGSGFTSLTHNVLDPNVAATGDLYPRFSPNGELIAYSHVNGAEFLEIWIMDADGTNPHFVAASICSFDRCSQSYNRHPSFSPDGTKLVYDAWESISSHIALEGIAVVGVNGTDLETYLTINDVYDNFPLSDTRPSFTNDGSKIAFTRDDSRGSISLQIMDAWGSAPVPLYDPGVADAIAFLPRAFADRILFTTNVDLPGSNAFDIYSILPDRSGLTRLTDNAVYDAFDESRRNYPAGGDLPDEGFPTVEVYLTAR